MSPFADSDLVLIEYTMVGTYTVRRGDVSPEDGDLLTDDEILDAERQNFENLYEVSEFLATQEEPTVALELTQA